jgi:hypothetical protein
MQLREEETNNIADFGVKIIRILNKVVRGQL